MIRGIRGHSGKIFIKSRIIETTLSTEGAELIREEL